jgi:hypothetical protein
MKTFFSILAALAVVSTASAQWVQGPSYQDALAETTPFFVGTMVATNVPTTSARVGRVGANGFGFYATIGSTNSAATTNGGLVVEFVSDPNGTNANNSTLQTATFTLTPNGTSPYYYWSNVPPTIANVGNLTGVRIKYITNNNTHSLWLTNAYFITR